LILQTFIIINYYYKLLRKINKKYQKNNTIKFLDFPPISLAGKSIYIYTKQEYQKDLIVENQKKRNYQKKIHEKINQN